MFQIGKLTFKTVGYGVAAGGALIGSWEGGKALWRWGSKKRAMKKAETAYQAQQQVQQQAAHPQAPPPQ